MKRLDFTIPLYDVDVTLIQVQGKEDADEIRKLLDDINVDKEFGNYTIDGIRKGVVNGGDTYRNMEMEKMIAIFYIAENDKKRENIYAHEKRHIEDRVLEHCGVNDIEASAYLAGWLGEKFYEFKNI